jgi:hypothetical protein
MLLCLLVPSAFAETHFCQAHPDVRAEIEKAAAIPVADRSAFERNIAAWRALRERYPNDLFVQESYQDAVKRFGIEGYLRVLTDEYQALAAENSGELIYRYLFARSLMGRGTYPAIQEMNEIIASDPGFAPAHRMLAEIYSTEAFRDDAKENAYWKSFLDLCPGVVLQKNLNAAADPSPLIDQAEHLLAENGNPDRIVELADQGLKDDEWRLQRIRPFDWYSTEYKIRNQRQLQVEYWTVWGIEVRSYRKAGETEKAARHLAVMDQRSVQLRGGPSYWDALVTMARLYAEGNERERAEEKIEEMRKVLGAQPDAVRAAQREELRKLVETPRALQSQAAAKQ